MASRGSLPRRDRPLLLQVCASDHPPFGDICRYHAAAAAELSWRAETVILKPPVAAPEATFHYPRAGFGSCAAALLDGEQPILVICHRYRAYRAVMTSRLIRAPAVAVAHEFGFFRRRRRRWLRRWDRLRGRPSVAFAGVSDAVAFELASVVGDACLLPNGIDLARADGARLSRRDALARLGLPAGTFNIGVVGRLHGKKAPELAVAGFARAAGRMPDARLVLLGDGERAGRVRAMSADLPVMLPGYVADAAVLMAAFDLLLMPSGRHEAFGMVALEAMAAGVPVLHGASPGPRFVVGDAGCCFSAHRPDEVGTALQAAYQAWCDGSLAAVGRRGRARVEHEFSVAAGVGRLQALALA